MTIIMNITRVFFSLSNSKTKTLYKHWFVNASFSRYSMSKFEKTIEYLIFYEYGQPQMIHIFKYLLDFLKFVITAITITKTTICIN